MLVFLIHNKHNLQVPPGIQSTALDMMTVLIRNCPKPSNETLMMDTTFLAVVKRVLNTDDTATQQNGGECIRAYVSVAPDLVSVNHDKIRNITSILHVLHS